MSVIDSVVTGSDSVSKGLSVVSASEIVAGTSVIRLSSVVNCDSVSTVGGEIVVGTDGESVVDIIEAVFNDSSPVVTGEVV